MGEVIAILGTVVTALLGAVAYLFKEVLRLTRQETNCQKRLARVETELAGLHAVNEQRNAAESEAAAFVVADIRTQQITYWSPAATLLLHWPERKILGKLISVIIPPRFRQKHFDASNLLVTGQQFPRGEPIEGYALTMEGAEVPVSIKLSGWAISGVRYIGATIFHRVEDDADDGNNNDGRDPQTSPGH